MEEVGLSGIKNRFSQIPSTIWAGLSFLLPFLYCLYWGRIGFNPLDSPIVFDGGFRILQGQEYLVDFFSPAGYIPSLLQALFHRIFGVNWFSFCLHAAVFNGLFSLLAFQLFRHFKANALLALFYALLSGMVFYAPFGTPYPEQHSFFFSLLGIYLLAISPHHSGRKLKAIRLFTGPAFLFAFFSKPVPAAYAIILGLILLPFVLNPHNWKKSLVFLSGGTLAGLLLLTLALQAWKIDFDQARFFFWELPSQTGMDRLTTLSSQDGNSISQLFTKPFKVFATYNDPFVIFCYAVPGLFIFLGLANRFTKWKWVKPFTFPNRNLLLLFVLGSGFAMVSSLFVRLTFNQEENGIPFIFLHLGLIHILFIHYINGIRKNYGGQERYWKGIVWGIGLLLLFFVVKDSVNFHQQTIATRKVHDFPADQEIPMAGPEGLSGMEWMLWQEPWRYGDRNMDTLLSYLKTQDEPFFYFGDMSFIYGLLGQPSPLPSLWLHEGLTIPKSTSTWFHSYETQLIQNLNELNPVFLIADNPELETYTGFLLKDMPRVHAWCRARIQEPYLIGSYSIWRLGSPGIAY